MIWSEDVSIPAQKDIGPTQYMATACLSTQSWFHNQGLDPKLGGTKEKVRKQKYVDSTKAC